VYSDAGITINGLDALGFHEMPGNITDVDFPDADRGYAIACDDRGCTLGRTTDGGLTWTSGRLPAEMGRSVDLLPFSGDVLLAATGGHTAWRSDDDGRTWRSVPPGTGTVAFATEGQLLRLGGHGVEVWSARSGYLGDLAEPPPIDVRWVASGPAADGAWWVGGLERGSGRPAIAVSTDGGGSWTPSTLAVPGGGASSVQVSLLGSHAYALVLAGNGAGPRPVVAIFHSADGGRHFVPTRAPGVRSAPASVAGELVPLLDGRLLIAGGDHRWYVSADDGATFTGEHLPVVGRLDATPAGYLAYDLFGSDWAAFSSDGSTWRKLRTY
jgi:hypothetical protein